jgi:hypothetical protein
MIGIIILAYMVKPAFAGLLAESQSPSDQGWPRVYKTADGITNTVFQPQLESWDGYNLNAYAAVAVQAPGTEAPIYGVAYIKAHTVVNKSERLVHINDLTITGVRFPSAPEKESPILLELREAWPKNIKTVSLDRLEASLAIAKEQKKVKTLPLRNNAPRILFSTKPAILVYIDGEPRFTPVKGTGLSRALNTRVLLMKDLSGKYYLHVFDGYLEASALDGPWNISHKLPKDTKIVESTALETQQVDMLQGQEDPQTKIKPTLKKIQPEIIVSTTPAELIVTQGPPDYVPLEGTRLLYIKNTSANVLKDTADQKTYVLISGRWFRAGSILGPWEYVPAKNLPRDFADISDNSPKENVKASVPGTPQAEEVLIADSIPQTAQVDRKGTTFTPDIDGRPQLKPIEDTPLSYVVNSPAPIIQVNDRSWYACDNGVWFHAASLTGPWAVADSVPAVIYSIPPSSPLYYVTFVRVYNATEDSVYCGYTPGYYGSLVSPDDVVVYGTGYYYDPWVGNDWWGYPLTYGCGSGLAWTPWNGWYFAFGFGWGWGPYWYYPPAPWWGPFFGFHEHFSFRHHFHHRFHHRNFKAWGPGGWANTSFNIYQFQGKQAVTTKASVRSNTFTGNTLSARYGRAYNSTTGALIVGHNGAVRNVFPGRRTTGQAAITTQNGVSEARERMREGRIPAARSVPAPAERRPVQPGAASAPRGEQERRVPPERVPAQPRVMPSPTGRRPEAVPPQVRQPAPERAPAPVRQPSPIGIGKNNAFATPEGRVFLNRGEHGGWQQVNPSRGAERINPPRAAPNLTREQGAREMGQQRTEVFQSHRPSRGPGGREGGPRGGARGGVMMRH